MLTLSKKMPLSMELRYTKDILYRYIRIALHKLNKIPIFLVNEFLAIITCGGVPPKWPLRDRSNWLQKLAFSIPTLQLHEVALPGTHQSPTYLFGSIAKPYRVCQNSNILEQLRSGIRYLDFRVCDDAGFDNHLWVSHTLLAQHLEPQIVQIRQFLDEQPYEIVLLLIKPDFDRHLSSRGIKKLNDLIHLFFSGRLITQRDIETRSIVDLIRSGKQLALIDVGHLNLLSNPDPPCMESSWDATNGDDPQRVATQLNIWARTTIPILPNTISNLEVIVTPVTRTFLRRPYKSIYSLSQDLLRIVFAPGGLFGELAKITDHRRVNVLSFDFATDDMIETTIALNYRKTLDESGY